MTQAKPSSGPWINKEYNEESLVLCDLDEENYEVVCSGMIGTTGVANAALIAEAGTVYHETQLTPRQLLAQRDALLEVLEFYADPRNLIFMDNRFFEFGYACIEETQYRHIGTRAKDAIAKIEGKHE